MGEKTGDQDDTIHTTQCRAFCQQQVQPPQAPPPQAGPSAPRNQHPGEQVPPSQLPKGAVNPEKLALQRKHNSSKKSIRQLRQLIREKYRLDVWIWDHRDVLEADRDIVKADYVKADVIMQEIYHIVNHWEEDLFDNPEEWRVAKKIKESINKNPEQHRSWNELPPWDRDEEPPAQQAENVPVVASRSELSL